MKTDIGMDASDILDDTSDNLNDLDNSDSEDTDEIDLQPYCDEMKWSSEDNKKWLEQSRTVFEEVKQALKKEMLVKFEATFGSDPFDVLNNVGLF